MEEARSAGKKKAPVRQNFDYVLLTVVLFLLGFGLIMIYSASSYEASVTYNDASFYLVKQAKAIVIGLFALIITSRWPHYKRYQNLSPIFWIISLVLVVLVKTSLGHTSHGATRWLKIGSLTVQPAEIVKVAIILLQANLITKMGKSLETVKGVIFYFIPPVVSSVMIYFLTKNLSSAVIVFLIAFFMLFAAVKDIKIFAIVSGAMVLLIVGGIYFVLQSNIFQDYRMDRIRAWLDPYAYSTDKSFQTLQALYAIGSGGIWGKGLGQSMQKRRFLPEAQNDMIFSIICEELGLFGAIAVLALFLVLIISCQVIANNTIDRYGSLIVVGVMSHYAIQVILNVAVVTKTIPNTGITLPFISYGGSAVLFLLIEIGLVLNVSQRAKVVT